MFSDCFLLLCSFLWSFLLLGDLRVIAIIENLLFLLLLLLLRGVWSLLLFVNNVDGFQRLVCIGGHDTIAGIRYFVLLLLFIFVGFLIILVLTQLLLLEACIALVFLQSVLRSSTYSWLHRHIVDLLLLIISDLRIWIIVVPFRVLPLLLRHLFVILFLHSTFSLTMIVPMTLSLFFLLWGLYAMHWLLVLERWGLWLWLPHRWRWSSLLFIFIVLVVLDDLKLNIVMADGTSLSRTLHPWRRLLSRWIFQTLLLLRRDVLLTHFLIISLVFLLVSLQNTFLRRLRDGLSLLNFVLLWLQFCCC